MPISTFDRIAALEIACRAERDALERAERSGLSITAAINRQRVKAAENRLSAAIAKHQSDQGSQTMTTTLPNAEQNLLNIINAAYEGGELRINEDLPRGERGDTLADFIRAEVLEVMRGEEHPLQCVIDALRVSIEQLERCVAAIEYLDNETLNRDPAELALENGVRHYACRFAQAGFPEGALDDVIHDLLASDAVDNPGDFLSDSDVTDGDNDDDHERYLEAAQDAAGEKAAKINNEGMEAQIEYLLKRDRRDLLDEHLAAGVSAAA